VSGSVVGAIVVRFTTTFALAARQLGVGGVSAGAAQLVGRERELATLRGLNRFGRSGNGSVAMVFSEP
jgi:hypothetical protein